MLDSAAWLTREAGECVADRAGAVYHKLARAGPVRLDAMIFALAAELSGAEGSGIHEVVSDFQQRWLAILGDVSGRSVQRASEDLAPLIQSMFPDGEPVWAASRQHSPDVMMRRDPQTGGLTWVLGELHLACNTLENRTAFSTHALDTVAMTRLTEQDMAAGRVVALFSRRSEHVTPRAFPPLASHLPDLYRYWSFTADRTMPPEDAQECSSTEIEVAAANGGLVARAPSWEAPLTEVLGDLLTALVANRFRILEPAAHIPRVAIDSLVVVRERWRFDARRLVGGHSDPKLAVERCIRAVRDAGVPRHVFTLSAAERKPVYIDFESPALQRLFAHLVRRAEAQRRTIDVTEMMPRPDELWIETEQGAMTSELRLAVVRSGPAARRAWIPRR